MSETSHAGSGRIDLRGLLPDGERQTSALIASAITPGAPEDNRVSETELQDLALDAADRDGSSPRKRVQTTSGQDVARITAAFVGTRDGEKSA